MSHFTVMVIGENPEEQLRPFNEQPEGADAEELFELSDSTDEARAQYEDPKFMVWASDKDRRDVPVKQKYKTFEAFCKKYHGYKCVDGRWGYMQNTDETGPNGGLTKGAKWDWYVLGGRWTGFMKLKPGAEGMIGRPGIMTEPGAEGWVDQCRKGDIDYDGMMEERFKNSLQAYGESMAEVEEKCKKHAEALTEPIYYEALTVAPVPCEDGTHIKRRIFLDNPFTRPEEQSTLRNPAPTREEAEMVIETAKAQNAGWRGSYEIVERTREDLILQSRRSWLDFQGIAPDEDTGNFDADAEKHARRTQDGTLSTFAILKDGEWFERGAMGWWGMVVDEKDCETWRRQFWEMFESLPDDTLISIYDCHI